MPAHFAEVLLRVYTKDVRFVHSPHPVTGSITELRHSFFGIVQAGYRSLLARTAKESEPTSIDVQSSESEGIPERCLTPKTFSRVSSFNKSFSVGPGDSGEDESPFLNQFTTVSKGYGKLLASPTKLLAPRQVGVLVANLGSGTEQTEEHAIEVYAALQAPASPTRAKLGVKHVVFETLAEPDEGLEDTSKLSPSRNLRTSKRLRNERGGSRVKEESGGTPSKRRKV